jgi:hypothetical protein
MPPFLNFKTPIKLISRLYIYILNFKALAMCSEINNSCSSFPQGKRIATQIHQGFKEVRKKKETTKQTNRMKEERKKMRRLGD